MTSVELVEALPDTAQSYSAGLGMAQTSQGGTTLASNYSLQNKLLVHLVLPHSNLSLLVVMSLISTYAENLSYLSKPRHVVGIL